ncbi:MAG TPA: hypothetical protein VGD37_29130 [Kofleriaceae bacterium]|jgi:hypothetical protein
MTRVYFPATLDELAELRALGEIPAGRRAHAVTPALREWYAGSDTDELENAAFLDAERRSLRRLAAQPQSRRLRVVLSADVPDSAVRPDGGQQDEDRAVVLVQVSVPLAAVASIHADEPDAEPDVVAALEALARLDAGDDDAQFVVDGAEGHDLLWFDVTELDDVLALRGSD